MELKDFICGLFAGWAQVVSGQPLDIIKIKLQSSSQKSKIKAIATDIYVKHGIRGFYLGSSSLFFTIGPIIAVQFLVYETSKRFLLSLKNHEKISAKDQSYAQFTSKLSLLDISIAGTIVGAVSALIYCPTEYTKIQRQLNPHLHRSSLGLLWNQLKNNGNDNHYLQIICRDCILLFFLLINHQEDDAWKEINAGMLHFLIAGAVAGLTYWLISYPFDVVKTKVQNHVPYPQAFRQFLKQGYRGSVQLLFDPQLQMALTSQYINNAVKCLIILLQGKVNEVSIVKFIKIMNQTTEIFITD